MRIKGFTLIELIITLFLSALLLLVAVPSFQQLLDKSRLDATAHKLRGLLHQTRQLAVSEQSVITFCSLNSSNNCQANWSSGVLTIFRDENNNRAFDKGEQVFNQLNDSFQVVQLNWSGSGGRPYIRFTPLGDTKEFGSLSITVNQKSRKLTLNRSGRIYIKKL